MDLAELAAQCGVTPNGDGEIETQCLKCGGKALLWVAETIGKLWARCEECGKLEPETLIEALNAVKALPAPNGHSNGHVARLEDDPQQAVLSWKIIVSDQVVQFLKKPEIAKWFTDDPVMLQEGMIKWLKESGPPTPIFLSATEVEEEYWDIVRHYVPLPKNLDDPPLTPIKWETFDSAVVANEAYLLRTPVVEALCYSSAVSMITGGKHAGKSTLARWMAVCVSKGWQFLGRQVTQGPVFYIASEDETMAARQELIRLGWNNNDPLRFLSAQNIADIEAPEKFLASLAGEIKRAKAVLVVLDMLFDFVRISDEMSYAGTRHAVGAIQQVASESEGHIVAIHHAPKNALIGDAAVAALGSQGLAARVSPIVLVRRFGPGVHSISSTSVRDPRGKPILESRLVKNEDGSVELGGAWKNYMLAEVYVERVKELLEAEPGAELTAPEVAENLTISYEVARSCLSTMYRNGLVSRQGSGKKGKPFRYSSLISSTNDLNRDSPFPPSVGDVGYLDNPESAPKYEEQGRFGYKER